MAISIETWVPPFAAVEIRAPFWRHRQRDTAEAALLAQWDNLERTGTIDNFRIAAGRKTGRRRGFFYVDSDAHKWADAAARTLQILESPEVEACLSEFVEVVAAAQADDGYLFTYNQIHFAGQRWINLQIEHELYTFGHLIEAGVAAAALPRHRRLLDVARKGADLLVRDFQAIGPEHTPGHPEVELALLRLAALTGEERYALLAERFLEQRGLGRWFGIRLLRELVSHSRRARLVRARQAEADPVSFDVQENLYPGEGAALFLRSVPTFVSGRLLQQHAPIRAMREPVGHAVRWGYLAAGAAMLARERNDAELLASLDAAWCRMVSAHMYVTGGVGALPIIEGFGNEYELDNVSAYCETCAAIASVLWSREMLHTTGEARFADLIEWQLYNAVAVGMSLDGCSYLYRNPLESAAGIIRRAWFRTACCPSNVSRIWASLGEHTVSCSERGVWVHQYWSTGLLDLSPGGLPLRVRVDSELPWNGSVCLEVEAEGEVECPVHLRIPAWSGAPRIRLDGEPVALEPPKAPSPHTASGYSPFTSCYVSLSGPWRGRSRIELELPMDVRLHRADARVECDRGKVALSRGPVVYCLEAIDNPGVSLPAAILDRAAPLTWKLEDHLGGCVTIGTRTVQGKPLHFVPYFAWGNRNRCGMQVWVQASG